jgi:hypothetical protein
MSASDPSPTSQFVQGATRSGAQKTFDTSDAACAGKLNGFYFCFVLLVSILVCLRIIDFFTEFGFYAGERVQTPRGPAWVVGVNSGDLYFTIDGDSGIDFLVA